VAEVKVSCKDDLNVRHTVDITSGLQGLGGGVAFQSGGTISGKVYFAYDFNDLIGDGDGNFSIVTGGFGIIGTAVRMVAGPNKSPVEYDLSDSGLQFGIGVAAGYFRMANAKFTLR
jgi:hypothetical protein